MHTIKIRLTIVIALFLGGCTSGVDSVIEVGMEFNNAEKTVLNFGAQKVQLQIIPEKSITGEYMKLEIYKIRNKPYIVINHEEENGKDIIKAISLYYIEPGSKKNSHGRTLETIDKIDLNKLKMPADRE